MKLLYGEVVVGTIDGAFVSDGSWFGDFLQEPVIDGDRVIIRVAEFIEFCKEWHERLAAGADADASEFEQFADLLSSGSWHMRAIDGSDRAIVEAPVFIGNEITWRTE
jgi:hypothetical protein